MEHVLSLSYGKDSLACLGAIEELGWPLDRIIHAEVWATDTIPADLPPMVEFKAKADAIIRERWGIQVQHIRANQYTLGAGGKDIRTAVLYNIQKRKSPWCDIWLADIEGAVVQFNVESRDFGKKQGRQNQLHRNRSRRTGAISQFDRQKEKPSRGGRLDRGGMF